MKTTFSTLVAVTLATAFSGCSFIPRQVSETAYEGFGVRPLKINNDGKMHDVSQVYAECTGATLDQQKAKDCLRTTIAKAISASNEYCIAHLKEIYGNDAAFNITTGSFATLSSGAASITNGGSAKLLAAISTFFNAERSLVNETIYKNQITTHIGIKISQSRATTGAAIRAELATTTYDIAQAAFDIDNYHNSCSFYNGLQKVLEEGTNTTPSTRLSQLEVEQENLLIRMSILSQKLGGKSSQDPTYKNLEERLTYTKTNIQALRKFGVSSPTASTSAAAEVAATAAEDARKSAEKSQQILDTRTKKIQDQSSGDTEE